MSIKDFFEIFNYGLILIFGIFISTLVSGGWSNKRQKTIIFSLCPILLVIQGLLWFHFGVESVRYAYPLIIHLPIVLVLVFLLKKKLSVAVISVCTAYLCCQIPRWINLVFSKIVGHELIGSISYTFFVIGTFFLLYKFFTNAAHQAIVYSTRTMVLFGSLPIAYYIFDYATAVYSDILYSGEKTLSELFPTVTIVFYTIFIAAYHAQVQNRMEAERQKTVIEASLKRFEDEIESLRRSAKQTSIYQHDMRHHMNMLDGMLSAGQNDQAQQYIKKVHADIQSIAQKRFCENETVNLLCSFFDSKAKELGINFKVFARVPKDLSVSDTEICSLLSNGIENAIHAVEGYDQTHRTVDVYCDSKNSKLLIEIKNPCLGNVVIKEDIPVSSEDGHGYGCQSICAITERYGGLYHFDLKDETFILRVMLPL